MLTVALQACGADPSFAVGGELAKHGTNAHHGTGEVFVAEADESDGSFLRLPARGRASSPTSSPTTWTSTARSRRSRRPTSRSRDRVERWPAGRLRRRRGVAALAERGARRRACACSPTAGLRRRRRPAGGARGSGADLVPRSCTGRRHQLRRCRSGSPAGTTCSTPPRRSSPATAGLGQDPRPAPRRACGFTGTRRRFEPKGEAGGVSVVDDYAHNPGKVAAVVEAGREQAARRDGSSWCSSRTCTRAPGTSRATFAAALRRPTSSWSWTSTPPARTPCPGVAAPWSPTAVAGAAAQVHYVPSWSQAAPRSPALRPPRRPRPDGRRR